MVISKVHKQQDTNKKLYVFVVWVWLKYRQRYQISHEDTWRIAEPTLSRKDLILSSHWCNTCSHLTDIQKYTQLGDCICLSRTSSSTKADVFLIKPFLPLTERKESSWLKTHKTMFRENGASVTCRKQSRIRSLSSLKLTSFSGISHNSSINSPVTVPFFYPDGITMETNIPGNTTYHLEHQTHHCQLGEGRESEKALNASFKDTGSVKPEEVVTKSPVVFSREIRQSDIMTVTQSSLIGRVLQGLLWKPCSGLRYTNGKRHKLHMEDKSWICYLELKHGSAVVNSV